MAERAAVDQRLAEAFAEARAPGAGARPWFARAGTGNPALVLFGAGHLGRKVRAALAGTGPQVLAFADSDAGKWGQEIDGVPVLSPEEAVARFGCRACFVVTIWRAEGPVHRFQDTETRLRGLGAERVAHFGHLARAFPDGLLPHYALDRLEPLLAAEAQILAGPDRFADPASRDVFIRHALWRLTLDFDLLPESHPSEIYFPTDLIRPRAGEVLADVGAFDGDTCARMIALWGSKAARIHAFEPDPGSVAKFRSWAEGCPFQERIHLHPVALGAGPGTLRFQGAGALNAAPGDQGIAVPRTTLDDCLRGDPPSYLKMDIEGAEEEALLGARAVLATGPALAVCLYHVQHHLWTLPALVQAILPGHRLHLRSHGTDGWELVLYAVPPEGP